MEPKTYDFIIIGGGAAGLTAAIYGARSRLKTLVLEEALAGGQAQNITDLENYPGLFPPQRGYTFSETLEKQAQAFGAEICQQSVKSLKKTGSVFEVAAGSKVFAAPAVLLACGASPRKLEVPGEAALAGRGVSYCATCDGPFFRNKGIAVIGGGNAACDEALYLASLTDKVTVIHRKGEFRASKTEAERVLHHQHITVKFDTMVTEIRGSEKVEALVLENTKTREKELFPVEGVFIFVGQNPRTELIAGLESGGHKTHTDSAGFVITGEHMSTGIPGLYCAGDLRAKPLRQVVTAASDGAIAAYSAGAYIRELQGDVYQ